MNPIWWGGASTFTSEGLVHASLCVVSYRVRETGWRDEDGTMEARHKRATHYPTQLSIFVVTVAAAADGRSSQLAASPVCRRRRRRFSTVMQTRYTNALINKAKILCMLSPLSYPPSFLLPSFLSHPITVQSQITNKTRRTTRRRRRLNEICFLLLLLLFLFFSVAAVKVVSFRLQILPYYWLYSLFHATTTYRSDAPMARNNKHSIPSHPIARGTK